MSEQARRSATGLTGAAGEYHVAAELSRRDWLATVTIKNSPGTDVLAQKRDRSAVVAVQVKTASPGNNFTLNLKDEAPGIGDNEWYVLVSLAAPLERPSFYVMPRHAVAAVAFLEHRDWLAGAAGRLHNAPRAGVQRTPNERRTIRPAWIAGYLEMWELLDRPSREALFLGDPAFIELACEVPLPSEYGPLRAPH